MTFQQLLLAKIQKAKKEKLHHLLPKTFPTTKTAIGVNEAVNAMVSVPIVLAALISENVGLLELLWRSASARCFLRFECCLMLDRETRLMTTVPPRRVKSNAGKRRRMFLACLGNLPTVPNA